MKIVPKQFLVSLGIITAVIGLLSLASTLVFPGLITVNWGWLLLLFLVITWGVFYGFQNLDEKKFARFSNYFMLSSMLKILLLLVVISIYAFSCPKDAIRFSATLFVFYVCFLVFEVYWILKLSKPDEKNNRK